MDRVGSLLDRPRLYYNIDGLGELGGGITCLAVALLFWLLIRSPADSAWHQIPVLVFIGLALLVRYGAKAVKTRITYPRTGFVEYRERWQPRAIAAVGGALATAGLAGAFRLQWDTSMLASLTGLGFAASYGYHFASAVRWKWVIAGVLAVASILIAVLPGDVLGAIGSESPPHPDRAKLFGTILLSLMVYGALLLISGGVSLWLYLRHTQAPTVEDQ